MDRGQENVDKGETWGWGNRERKKRGVGEAGAKKAEGTENEGGQKNKKQ